MIKSIEFKNFRNVNGKYYFNSNLNVIIGKNNSGKTNILDGIRLAFSCLTNDYFKITSSDFKNSKDDQIIEISVELDNNSIPSLIFHDEQGNEKCGFKVKIKKSQNTNRYIKEISLLDGSNVDLDILREDNKIPNLYMIPIIRIEDIYTAGLTAGISHFITSEEKYKNLVEDSKKAIKEELKEKTDKFKNLCSKFNENLDIKLTDPKFSNEKVYIVDGNNEYNFNIGSGYKSIANIMLNTLDEKFNIILIDEIENHLHPALIRTLIRELRKIYNTMIIATTHSSVVINELDIKEIIDVSTKNLDTIADKNILRKLNIFLTPGRNELMLADYVILVEGYTEELLLKNYLRNDNYNWTIVNVAGVMFEPYICLAKQLNKKTIVISDTDIILSDKREKSSRYNKLETICKKNEIKIIPMNNTLETDLYNSGYLDKYIDLLKPSEKHDDIYIARKNKKTEIALKLIEDKVNLDDWHIIKEIKDEFQQSN